MEEAPFAFFLLLTPFWSRFSSARSSSGSNWIYSIIIPTFPFWSFSPYKSKGERGGLMSPWSLAYLRIWIVPSYSPIFFSECSLKLVSFSTTSPRYSKLPWICWPINSGSTLTTQIMFDDLINAFKFFKKRTNWFWARVCASPSLTSYGMNKLKSGKRSLNMQPSSSLASFDCI